MVKRESKEKKYINNTNKYQYKHYNNLFIYNLMSVSVNEAMLL